MKTKKFLSLLIIVVLILGFGTSQALADTATIDFEGYALGTVHNQDGWSSAGAAGSGCAVYDHAIVDATPYGYPAFGTRSLRMSNAVTSGCFGDQTFSKSLVDEAGESTAVSDGLSGGTRQSYFEAQWDFMSTVPGAQQAGLSVVASPDRGDGARMSWIQMTDASDGLQVNFYDYQESALPAVCDGNEFVFSNVASGLDRTVPHTIKVQMYFVDGEANDVVKVSVDGTLLHTGTSWEDYFRNCEGNPTRPVDSVLFRTGGSAAPATASNGFLIDNLTLFSGIDNDGPTTTNVVASPNPAPLGGSVDVTANVDDSSTGGWNIASAEYSLDGGTTWSSMAASDGAFDEVSEDVATSFSASATPGIYTLCVRGTDAAGNVGAAECIMFVEYDPDGGFVTGGGWIDSPAGAMPPMLVWNQGFEANADGWFDANSGWYGTVTRVPSGINGVTSSSGNNHAVFEGDADSGPFSRFDGYRSIWPGTWTAEVDVYLDPAWASGTGFDYSVAATGTNGAHRRDFIFHVTKDTSTGKLFVAGSNNTNFAPREDLENINHYEVSSAGWYTFQHIFRDQGGALAVDLNLLDANGNLLFTETRFDPTDLIPSVVGGNRYSWFTFINVAGGVVVDEHQLFMPSNLTGKATFGFVSKYRRGATVPDGNTEFQFKAGNLNFSSTSYQWLVVNQGGTNAQFKGYGTINGAGNYGFMLWAGDGSADTFRIKIWDAATEIVVYDNGTDQAIGGGSIVIHRR